MWQPLERLVDQFQAQGFISAQNRALYQRVEGIDDVLPALAAARPAAHPLIRGSYARPGLRGHRADGSGWSVAMESRIQARKARMAGVGARDFRRVSQ